MLDRKAWVLILGTAAALYAAGCAGQLQVAPGEWRLRTLGPVAPLHYSTCLPDGRVRIRDILRHEGGRCRIVGPLVVQGAVVVLRERCQLAAPGGRGTVAAAILVRLRLAPDRRSFRGEARIAMNTPLGTLREHQAFTGHRSGPCRAR